MDNYNEYKTNELIEILEFLEKDQRPSINLFQIKSEIRKITAKKLKVNVKDVIKIFMKEKKEQEEKRRAEYNMQNRMKLAIDKIQTQINKINEKIDKLINEQNGDIPIS